MVAIGALWWIASHYRWLPPLFLPTPETVFTRLWESARGQLTDAPLATHFGWSMFRVFTAFLLACVTAIPIGIAMGVSRIARGIFDPPIEFYRPLPPLAYLPLIIIWFGIDELSKVLLIYLACFAPLAMSARAGRALGLAGADPRRVFDGRVAMAGHHACRHPGGDARDPDGDAHLDRVRLDDARRRRNGRGDLRAGQMVLNASNFLRTDIVIMGIVVIGAVAYLFDLLMRQVERVVVPWKGKV